MDNTQGVVFPKRLLDIESIAKREYTKALKKAGRGLKRTIRATMVAEDAIASFETYNAIEESAVHFETDRMSLEVKPHGDRARAMYFIEHGREPGGNPPLEPIIEWMAARGIGQGLSEGETIELAKSISRHIGEYGVEGRHIFEKSIRFYNPRIQQIFEAATRRIARIISEGESSIGDDEEA